MAAEPGTRERVLELVSSLGPISAAAIAEHLGLTATGVRRHLDALAAQEAVAEYDVAPTGTTRGPGRPARAYVVAGAGHKVLPAGYADLATELLAFLDERSPDIAAAFTGARSQSVERRYRDRVAAAGEELAARADALVGALSADGFAATARPVGAGSLAGIQICQGHCPIQQVAAAYPALCDAETAGFSRLLGRPVQRLATLAAGHHVCTTFIPTPGPVGPGQTHQERTSA